MDLPAYSYGLAEDLPGFSTRLTSFEIYRNTVADMKKTINNPGTLS
jgi:hypothetical protein